MTGIDTTRPFMPESLTPLAYTAIYRDLSEAERLRYNQLHALFFHEQIIFFEQTLVRNVAGAFLREDLPAALRQGLRDFIGEEERHSAGFHELNRRCAPQFYAAGRFHFIRGSPVAARVLGWMTRHPRRFPLVLWLMLIQEERALHFGREFVRSADRLEPSFTAIQRAHVADEADHVRWDEELLDRVWPETSPRRRAVNVRLLAWMIGEFFHTPRRAGLRVIEALAAEFPALRARLPEMRRQMLALRDDEPCRRALYSATMLPRVARRISGNAVFAPLRAVLFGAGEDQPPATSTSTAATSDAAFSSGRK